MGGLAGGWLVGRADGFWESVLGVWVGGLVEWLRGSVSE